MKCDVKKCFGRIASQNGSDIELRIQLISWDGNEPKYDIRPWRGDYAMKGVILGADGMKSLKALLRNLDLKKSASNEKPAPDNKEEIVERVLALSSLPVSDTNFKTALNEASREEIEAAILVMEKSGGRHKTRIKACKEKLATGVGVVDKKKKDDKIIKFPTEKPKIVPLPASNEKHDYNEVCEKLNKEREIFKDFDSQYVIDGLLKAAKDDANLRANIMREDKSYTGAFEYFANKAREGYCVKYGNVSYLDNDMALELAIDYFNMESEVKKDDANKKKKSGTA